MIIVSIVLIILAVLLYQHFTWKALPWPEAALKPPPYQGHRGYWKEGAQENTLVSFTAAGKRGLQMIELDVRLSQDGIPVVFHDTDLKRLAQVEKIVQNLMAKELQETAQIPTLEEVFLSGDVPKFINVELKTSQAFNGDLEKAVADVVLKNHMESRILFSSFNPLALRRMSRLLPNVPRALLVTQERDPENKIYLRHLWFAPYARVHALHLDYHFVSIEELQKWQKRQVPVALWTVNEKDKAEEYLKAGALSIITDILGEKSV